MEIPYTQLSQGARRALVEEFITREGTDYGYETNLEDKVGAVLAQLERGEAVITFDPETESASITRAE